MVLTSDIEEITASLPNNSTAGLLCREHLGHPVQGDLLEMNAEVIDMGRIPPENIQKVEKDLAKEVIER